MKIKQRNSIESVQRFQNSNLVFVWKLKPEDSLKSRKFATGIHTA
jgi:hypothetical protein